MYASTLTAPLEPQNGYATWDGVQALLGEVSREEALRMFLGTEDPTLWLEPTGVAILAHFRADPYRWAQLRAQARQRGVSLRDMEALVDQHPDVTTRPRPRLNIINAEALLQKEFPPERWVIDDMLPPGCTLLTGRSKDGKSLMAYNLSVAVATGGMALGTCPVEAGDVLYLALEDGERRAQKRLDHQRDQMEGTPDLSRLDLVMWEAPRLGDGLEEALTGWIDTHPSGRLIVIDILEKVRPMQGRRSSQVYTDGYQATAPLTQLAQERNIAVVVVHHTNKTRPDDARDAVSGPMSLLGGADTFWGLKRGMGDKDATLHITGRDVAEQEWALSFDEGVWTLHGSAETSRLSLARKEVLAHLAQAGAPQTPKEIAAALGKPGSTMRKHLRRMAAAGDLCQVDDGYTVAARHGALGDANGLPEAVFPAPSPMPEAAVPVTPPPVGEAAVPVTLPPAGEAAVPVTLPSVGEAAVPVTLPSVGEAAVPVTLPSVGEAAVPVTLPSVGEAAVPVTLPSVGEAAVPVTLPSVGEAAVPVTPPSVGEAAVPVTPPPVPEAAVPVTPPPVPEAAVPLAPPADDQTLAVPREWPLQGVEPDVPTHPCVVCREFAWQCVAGVVLCAVCYLPGEQALIARPSGASPAPGYPPYSDPTAEGEVS